MLGGLLLAAGGSSRFGEPKQLAELDGRPLIEHPLAVLESMAAFDRVVVVLGAEAERIRAKADLGRADVVVASDWDEGMAASLRAGVDALSDTDAVVVLLGDQPQVTPAAIEAVLSHADEAPAVRASYGGRPGHPVLIKRELFDGVAGLRGDTGARKLLEASGVVTVECDSLAGGDDVDTPEDLAAMTRARRLST